jgi:DNA modification methylase
VDILRDCSQPKDIVLDPFSGSGTTMVAAERTGRSARLIEREPALCDLAIRRWQRSSGGTARLASSNKSFAQIEAEFQEADE